jgi:hypothetical protein
MPTFPLPRRRPLTALAVGLCAASIAACGGAAETESAAPNSGDDDAGRVRLQQCLRENGVDVPDNPGQGGAANVDVDALREALEGPCRELRSEGFGNRSEEDRQEFQDRFQAFAQCMRDEGIDVPDITAGDGPPGGGELLDTDDPDVQAAMEQCQDELPQGAGGPQ